MGAADRAVIEQLQRQIHAWEGSRRQTEGQVRLGLGALESAFPEGVFPQGVVHELLSSSAEEASCANGFISVLLGKLMGPGRCAIWIGAPSAVYPPAMTLFGVAPERVIFVEARQVRDALWAVEESLKCSSVAAVVGELNELGFNASRRLQLAVEQSGVTGFIHRQGAHAPQAVACVSRWRVAPAVSSGRLPGPGRPVWDLELSKVRNGRPGRWRVEWSARGLEYLEGEDDALRAGRKIA